MNRININKNDEVTAIAEKVIDSEAQEIVLSIPRFSRLIDSADNFHLLKREAEALDKKLVIESVDDQVIALAKSVGLECLNPFFGDQKKKFSDIVTEKKSQQSRPDWQPDSGAEEDLSRISLVKSARPLTSSRRLENFSVSSKKRLRGYQPRRRVFFSLFALIIIGGLFLALAFLPRADVALKRAKTEWQWSGQVVADLTLKAPNQDGLKIPGQRFVQKKNIQLNFPASGKRKVEKKASGKITVYNAHDTNPQILIATTRFEAPDGKIFRLVDKLTVPAAKIKEGKLEPSSIEAAVAADKPGEAYNIGPVKKFTIPGFAGSKKFETFYAESKDPMRGGFSGQAAFPDEADLAKAKSETLKQLEGSLMTLILAQISEDLKLIDKSFQFKVLREEVNPGVGDDNKFSVFAEAEGAVTVFKEQDLSQIISAKLNQEVGQGFEVLDQATAFIPEPPKAGKDFSFTVNYKANLAKKIDVAGLKQKLSGKSETEIKNLILSVSGIESAQVSLWPFWVRHVPENPEKINVTIDPVRSP